jgi:hypothetical protein
MKLNLEELLAKRKEKKAAKPEDTGDMKKGEKAPDPKPSEDDNKAEKDEKAPSGGKTLTGQKANKIDVEPEIRPLKEALNPQQRQKRAVQFRRMKARIEIGQARARRSRAARGRLVKRSRRLAIKNLQKRVLRTRKYHDLSYGERQSVDKRIKRSSKAIGRMAARLLPRVIRAETQRKLGGKWLNPMAKGAPMTEEILLSLVQELHSNYELTSAELKSLQEKAIEHDLPVEDLETVYRRGVAAWEDLEETDLTFQQFAFNRVNSFLSGGAAYDLDYDIVLEASEPEVPPAPGTVALLASINQMMCPHRSPDQHCVLAKKYRNHKILESIGLRENTGSNHVDQLNHQNAGLDHTYDYDDHVRVKATGKKGKVTNISPTGQHITISHPTTGKRLGVHHVSELMKLHEEELDEAKLPVHHFKKYQAGYWGRSEVGTKKVRAASKEEAHAIMRKEPTKRLRNGDYISYEYSHTEGEHHVKEENSGEKVPEGHKKVVFTSYKAYKKAADAAGHFTYRVGRNPTRSYVTHARTDDAWRAGPSRGWFEPKYHGGTQHKDEGTGHLYIKEDAMGGEKRRVDMPQITGFEEFQKDLTSAGHKLYEPVQFRPEKLTPTQKHFNQEKVDKIIKDGAHKGKPIIASKDGKIIDGHHRWEAARQAGDQIGVRRVSLGADELMAFCKDKPYVETKKLHEGHDNWHHVKNMDDWHEAVKKHHPDAKIIHHKNNISQAVVGPRQNPVGHWDDELGVGQVRKSHLHEHWSGDLDDWHTEAKKRGLKTRRDGRHTIAHDDEHPHISHGSWEHAGGGNGYGHFRNESDIAATKKKHPHPIAEESAEATRCYNKAQEHYEAAGKVRDRNSSKYHHHMANHHEHMGQWSELKGRVRMADHHYARAQEHVKKGFGLTEDEIKGMHLLRHAIGHAEDAAKAEKGTYEYHANKAMEHQYKADFHKANDSLADEKHHREKGNMHASLAVRAKHARAAATAK